MYVQFLKQKKFCLKVNNNIKSSLYKIIKVKVIVSNNNTYNYRYIAIKIGSGSKLHEDKTARGY